MSDYESTYLRMTDGQLLNLSNDRGSLYPEALVALNSELAKRNLGQKEVDEQAELVRRNQIAWENRGPLAQSFNGFGTSIYGKRDFQRDGSFITTLWIVFFWVPLIPLKSFRVKEAGHERQTGPFSWSQSYLVLSKSRPDIRQVINCYSFIFAPFVVGGILDSIDAGSSVVRVALAIWLCMPFALRKLAKSSGY